MLQGKFRRRSTGLIDWDEAKEAISKWNSWDDEMPAPAPLSEVVPEAPSKLTIAKAIKEFLKEHEGESAKTTVRTYRYLLEDFAEKRR
jgi:hypothetical protein